jgi:bifunctional DNase/RNase
MLVEIEFVSFAAGSETSDPLVVLKESKGTRFLWLPVGPPEAGAIAMEILRVKQDKPAAIHIAQSILESLGGKLVRSVLYLASSQSLMAYLEILARRTTRIECKPSDAIVLARRCGAPLLARESLFEAFSQTDVAGKGDALREHLSTMDTLDFGSCYLE